MTQTILKKMIKKGGDDQSRVRERKDESLPKDKRNVDRETMEIKKYSSQKQEAKPQNKAIMNKII